MPDYQSYTAAVVTEGCKVNSYESAAIAEALARAGFRVRPAGEDCDIYIVNTCTVTSASDKTARQMIRRLIAAHPGAAVIVTGCSVQAHADELASIPGIFALIGNRRKLDVVGAARAFALTGCLPSKPIVSVPPLDGAPFEPMTITRFDRIRPDVKIEDGCECRCTFCAIPDARGPVRSKPLPDVVREVTGLCRAGYREIVLTGIETGSWGRDLGHSPDGSRYTLASLLLAVGSIPGICRVRLGSLDPSAMTPDFVRTAAGLSCLAPHFHLSVQSGSSRTLARMKRRYNAAQAMDALKRLRAAIPGVQFTTDMIVGFPGETDEDFEETLDFARRAQFLKIHVFPYSRRPGTPAADMPDQVPPTVMAARADALSALSDRITADILDRTRASSCADALASDRPVTVLFERRSDGYTTGHTPDFMEVRVPGDINLRGRELPVRLTGRDGSVLLGELL